MQHDNAKQQDVIFPCQATPEDPAAARLLGIYPQRQDGVFLQRVKVPGGRLSTAQCRALAELARRFSPGYPLHMTTRQDVEIHGLRKEDLPAVQAGLHEVGLTSVGACGDTLRNITVCPGEGLCSGVTEISPLAEEIGRRLEALPFIRSLPRKFKISLSGCPKSCAKPWINDVGFYADGEGRFRAVVAGSLGARPGTGLLLEPSFNPTEALALTLAAVKLFNEEGDRQNRTRARLRHVRERLGDEVFRGRLLNLYRSELEDTALPRLSCRRVESHFRMQFNVPLPLGDIEPADLSALADGLESAGGLVRIGFEHNLLIWGDRPVELSTALHDAAGGPRIAACPGVTWCSRGIADTRAAAAALRAALPRGDALTICLSGCPNNCAQSAVADIGLIGRQRTVGEVKVDCFRLLAGGGKGQGPALGRELHAAIPAAQLPEAVAALVSEYAAVAASGVSFERFAAGLHSAGSVSG